MLGRYLAKDLQNAKGKVLIKKGELITEDLVEKIKKENIEDSLHPFGFKLSIATGGLLKMLWLGFRT